MSDLNTARGGNTVPSLGDYNLSTEGITGPD